MTKELKQILEPFKVIVLGKVVKEPICNDASCNNESQNFCDCFDFDYNEKEYNQATEAIQLPTLIEFNVYLDETV